VLKKRGIKTLVFKLFSWIVLAGETSGYILVKANKTLNRLGKREVSFGRCVYLAISAATFAICGAIPHTAVAEGEPEQSFWDWVFNREPTRFKVVDAAETKTRIYYRPVLLGAPNAKVSATALSALKLFRSIKDGAPSLPLLKRRAERDADLLKRILRSEGFYQSNVTLNMISPSPDDEEARTEIQLEIEPGSQFTLEQFSFETPQDSSPELPINDLKASRFGLHVGAPAIAADIVKAEALALAFLKRNGFPFAALGKRRTIADLDNKTIAVRTLLDPGPRTVFGPVTFSGLATVDSAYLRTYLPWTEGDLFDDSKRARYQRLISQTNLFAAVSVTRPETPPLTKAIGAAVEAPITVTIEEGPPRTIAGGLRFSTDSGPSVRSTYAHRNIDGRNAIFTLELLADVEQQQIGAGLRIPQFRLPGQDLIGSLKFGHEESERFDQSGVTAALALQKRVNPRLLGSIGAQIEAKNLIDDDFDGTVLLATAPLHMTYDGSDDQLDPRSGFRIGLSAEPHYGLQGAEAVLFGTLDAKASAYIPLSADKKWVFATRGRAGSILSAGLQRVPVTERLFSGGAASVRGYGENFIGERDDDGAPEGGRSVLEAAFELRGPVYENIGFVMFVEGGAVADDPTPSFENGIQGAVGLGARYASPVGPIRIDVATPIEKRSKDDRFQVYFSIGQAF
jgi:translocation and assembly module TamA